jgi:2-C-methyl-D-erythritol 4-phosphate cytidylyltransferase
LLDDAVGLLHDCDGAVPAVPLTDTVKLVDGDGVVCATPPRASLRAIQTPQVFRTAELCRAHEDARRHGVRGTDDATLIEALGLRVRVFPGDPRNFKITTPLDLLAARAMVAEGQPTS